MTACFRASLERRLPRLSQTQPLFPSLVAHPVGAIFVFRCHAARMTANPLMSPACLIRLDDSNGDLCSPSTLSEQHVHKLVYKNSRGARPLNPFQQNCE
jgi:hypothetical protein